jgi:hypothetical protein
MKKPIIVFALIAVMLVFIVSSSRGIDVTSSSVQTSTPLPIGQIDVPAVKVQLYLPGSNPQVNTVDASKRLAGFMTGVFHGVISPGTLIASLFNPAINMYEVHNNGSLYNFGFLLGAALIFLILGIFSGRRR